MLDRRPELSPASPTPDPVASISVVLLGAASVGLILGGVLAIYDWRTPAAVRPLFFTVLATFSAALVVLLLAATVRWARRAPR